MAVASITTGSWTQISDGTGAVLIQFRRPQGKAYVLPVVLVAETDEPDDDDWIEFATSDMIRFPAGSAAYAKAANGDCIAVSREFE